MMDSGHQSPHEERIRRVNAYIQRNLNGDLCLDTLSGVAGLSKYHFHRLYTAYTGVSLVRFIQLARLKRASFRLAFEHEIRIIDIALEADFESPEAFARAFKKAFGQTPSQFRRSPEWPLWHSTFEFNLPPRGVNILDIKVVDFATTRVAMLEHQGPPDRVYDSVSKFIAWRKATGLSPVSSSRTFGIPHSDPNTTDPAHFRFDICGSIEQAVPENPYGVKTGSIPGGRCAVARHRGSHDQLEETIYALYREWLPQSGEKWRDFPCFFHYLNFIHEVDECDLLTDIYLPIQS